MAQHDATRLSLTRRDPAHSRATRRLRREGMVPGVLYGGDGEPVSFAVDALVLRRALAASGAVLELELEGKTTPAVLKDAQRHPVRGQTLHVDFLRVRLDQPIQATVALELVGAEDSPGVKDGGVLEQVAREVTVEALPGDIPEVIRHDVSGLEAGATELLSAVTAPAGVTLVDDLEETVIASLTMPSIEEEPEEGPEAETEVVGEGGAEEQGAEGGEAPAGDGSAEAE